MNIDEEIQRVKKLVQKSSLPEKLDYAEELALLLEKRDEMNRDKKSRD